MSEIQGMLTRSALAALVEQGAIETVLVAFTDHYGRLMGKRYDARFFLEDALEHGAHATATIRSRAVAGVRPRLEGRTDPTSRGRYRRAFGRPPGEWITLQRARAGQPARRSDELEGKSE